MEVSQIMFAGWRSCKAKGKYWYWIEETESFRFKISCVSLRT